MAISISPIISITYSNYVFPSPGGFKVQIVVFDCQAESAEAWRSLAEKQEIRIEVFPFWDASAEKRWDPQLIIIDQSAVRSDFKTFVSELAISVPHKTIVATGDSLSVSSVVEMMRDGVNFVIEKPIGLEELEAEFVEIVEEATKLTQKRGEFTALQSLFAELTTRERDVLDHVMEGVSNKETAGKLNVSVRTIEARRAKVYQKTQSRSVVELVRKVDRLARLSRVFTAPRGESHLGNRPNHLMKSTLNPIAPIGVG